MWERMGVARTALGTQDRLPGSRGFCADLGWKHSEAEKDGEGKERSRALE